MTSQAKPGPIRISFPVRDILYDSPCDEGVEDGLRVLELLPADVVASLKKRADEEWEALCDLIREEHRGLFKLRLTLEQILKLQPQYALWCFRHAKVWVRHKARFESVLQVAFDRAHDILPHPPNSEVEDELPTRLWEAAEELTHIFGVTRGRPCNKTLDERRRIAYSVYLYTLLDAWQLLDPRPCIEEALPRLRRELQEAGLLPVGEPAAVEPGNEGAAG